MAGYNGEEWSREILDRLRRLRAEHPNATFNEMVELAAADRIRSGNPHLTGQGLNRLVEYLKRFPESGFESIRDRQRREMNEAQDRYAAEFDAVANDPKALHEWVHRPFALTSFLDVIARRANAFPPLPCDCPDCRGGVIRRTISYDGPDMNEVDAVLEELEKLS